MFTHEGTYSGRAWVEKAPYISAEARKTVSL